MSNHLAPVRDALHAALPGGIITPDRAHRFPQTGEYPTPCAWVGMPIVREGRGSTDLTIPVLLLVDGSAADQVTQVDAETCRLWDALRAVKINGSLVSVTAAAPDRYGPEGATVWGITFTLGVQLATRTLCGGPELNQP